MIEVDLWVCLFVVVAALVAGFCAGYGMAWLPHRSSKPNPKVHLECTTPVPRTYDTPYYGSRSIEKHLELVAFIAKVLKTEKERLQDELRTNDSAAPGRTRDNP